MSGFSKLFASIVTSTIWVAPDRHRITWITMLAMADKDGVVDSSIPGLAKMASVPLEDVEEALAAFMAPDKYSRTPDNDGRRIDTFNDGARAGWILLNHAKYREKRNEDERREYQRQWQAEKRAAVRAAEVVDHDVDSRRLKSTKSTKAEADTDTELLRSKALEQQAARGSARFEEFWAIYPEKKGKAAALRTWQRKRLDRRADEIIAGVRLLMAKDEQWLNGFVPHGSTFINGERWMDQPSTAKDVAKVTAPAPDPAKVGAKAALTPMETKLGHAISYIRQCHDRGDYGTGEEALATMARKMAEARREHAPPKKD